MHCCVLWRDVMQDMNWLSLVNNVRQSNKQPILSVDDFELIFDRLEKESFIASLDPKNSAGAENARRRSSTFNAQCTVCLLTESDETNTLLVCDACSLTVHQVGVRVRAR